PGQRSLKEALLPKLAIRLPPPGERLDPRGLFEEEVEDLWLAVRFGGGAHLAAQAAAHAAVGFLAREASENGVVKLLGEVERRGLRNARVLVDAARLLIRALPDRCLGRVFVLFPDPWPKARHHKRRFVSTEMLTELARVMKKGAELRLATDDVDYLRWMLERVPV